MPIASIAGALRRLAARTLPALLAGCVALEEPSAPTEPRRLTAAEGRTRVASLLPPSVVDRSGWATDIYAAIATLEIAPTAQNICAAIAVAEQESGLRVDPPVPGLPAIAQRELERQRERSGVPRFLLDAALELPSPDGRRYRERLEAVRTEAQLSTIFDDFIAMVPLGTKYFADRNPVRTGGPMQVSIAYAQGHAAAKPYPYPIASTLRHEVFTRRGGMYFGIAHLLDYPAAYDRPLYRFADFNAGHYASRNAAFQAAVTLVSGLPLRQDGDLLRYSPGPAVREAGETELATRALSRRLGMNDDAIRRDLESARTADFTRTRLYARVFTLADQASGVPVPRAVLPKIELASPKITRRLTTAWFAQQVDRRYQTCLARQRAG